MGRPPIGKVAMTEAERKRRQRAGLANRRDVPKQAGPVPKPSPVSDAAKDREIARLKAALAHRDREIAALKKGTQAGGLARRHPESADSRLRAENTQLKSDNAKLKMMLAEEPDTAKLRKKAVDQQVEMASMRRAMKEIGKERDKLTKLTDKRFLKAAHLASRQSYGVLVHVLHSDKRKHATEADLAEAERIIVAIKPLFTA
jgi:hypothetical protein